MSRRSTEADRMAYEKAVMDLLSTGGWFRPGDIAQQTGLLRQYVVRALTRLQSVHSVTRRERTISVVRGRSRPRLTSKPIIEYRMVATTRLPFELPILPVLGARPVRGRASVHGE